MPPIKHSEHRVTVSSKVTKEMRAQLDRLAGRERRSVSELVFFAVEEYLSRHEGRRGEQGEAMSHEISRTERGWAGHFICADKCMFRRNTLLSKGGRHVVVSTVGAMVCGRELSTIGSGGRYYETMVFVAKQNGPYIDIDAGREIYDRPDEVPWSICAEAPDKLPDDVDNIADRMHEANVHWITQDFDRLYQRATVETPEEGG